MLLRFFRKKKFRKNSLQTHKYNGIQARQFFQRNVCQGGITLAHNRTFFYNFGILNFRDFATDSYRTSYMFEI